MGNETFYGDGLTMFTGVQHVSALIEMHFYLLLNSFRLELRSASESIQPV